MADTKKRQTKKLDNPIEAAKSAVKKAKTKIEKKVAERKAEKSTDSLSNTVSRNRLKLLVVIVGRDKSEYYIDLLQSFNVNMQFSVLAHGTADAKMLEYIGLSDSDKVVIFNVIQEDKLKEALSTIEDKFRTVRNGKGIAYTIPLSSVIGKLIYGFLSDNRTVK